MPVGPFLAIFSLLLEIGDGHAALEALVPVVAVAIDVELEPLREGVDDRDADAVQAAGHLVAAAAELAAGVQHGEHDLGGRLVVLLHDADGDAAAVVDHGDRVVGVDGDVDAGRVPGERFVDGVVDDLVDEVVEAARAGGADVHAGPFADRLEALQDLDVLGVVTRLLHTTSLGWASLGGDPEGRLPCPARLYQNEPSDATGSGTEKCRKSRLFVVDVGAAAGGGRGAVRGALQCGQDGRPQTLVADLAGGLLGRPVAGVSAMPLTSVWVRRRRGRDLPRRSPRRRLRGLCRGPRRTAHAP